MSVGAAGWRGKRACDVLAAGVGLVLAAPVLAAAAVAVRLDSPGPVLFRQERVGLGGRTFTILKFRTMSPAAGGPLLSASGDRRVTGVGRWLRASKLDELPQLVNVVRGDMSLVGPRPEVPEYVARWDPARREVILSVRPGITDPASIAYRDEGAELAAAADPEQHYVQVLLPAKTASYVDYVATMSPRGDLAILLETLRALRRR